MGDATGRTFEKLSRQIDALGAELHEKEIESDLLEAYLEETDEGNPDRPSDETIELDLGQVLEERDRLEKARAALMMPWTRLFWRDLGERPREGNSW